MPLDGRTLAWLRENDIHRKYGGRQEKYFGQFFSKELDERQAELNREKQRKINDQYNEAFDRMHFEIKKLERKGIL